MRLKVLCAVLGLAVCLAMTGALVPGGPADCGYPHLRECHHWE